MNKKLRVYQVNVMQGFFNFLYAAEDWIVIIALVEKF
jgi:hypothetical protein